METLRISRSTLRNLRKEGVLKAERLPNGHYDFDPESVYKYLLEKSGKPAESKNGINIGKKNNQHFVSIPFRKLIELIKYKAQEAGIEVVEKEESFTSKTSPLADIFEVRKTGEKYLKAKKREDKELLKKLSIKLKELTQAERKHRGLIPYLLSPS